MPASPHVVGDHGVEAEGEHVVLVSGEGEPAGAKVGDKSGRDKIVTHFPDLSTFSLLTRWWPVVSVIIRSTFCPGTSVTSKSPVTKTSLWISSLKHFLEMRLMIGRQIDKEFLLSVWLQVKHDGVH